MAPLPKRRHSTRRGGKREMDNLRKKTAKVNHCPKCKSVKESHRICPKCGFYR